MWDEHENSKHVEAPEVDFSPPLASYFLEALMHSTYVI
jgi:hypothetical protein